jgi:hypothetical protein
MRSGEGGGLFARERWLLAPQLLRERFALASGAELVLDLVRDVEHLDSGTDGPEPVAIDRVMESPIRDVHDERRLVRVDRNGRMF